MRSSRSLEGLLQIDDRCSGGQNVELPVVTCCHCQRQVVLNPARTRERGWCFNCAQYRCDEPGCRDCNGSLKKIIDQAYDAAHRKINF